MGDVLLSVDFRSATQEASDGLAGYGTDRRALLGMLCGDECFDLHAAGESERLTLLENAYLRSLQVGRTCPSPRWCVHGAEVGSPHS